MLQAEKLKPIKSLILDVDGVLTDACVQLREDGEWVRRFNVRDGVGIKMILDKGFDVCVITGAKSGDVVSRIEFLGIKNFYRGIVDKTVVFDEYLEKSGFKPEECAYVGDDIFDVPLLEAVGFAVSVPFAIEQAKAASDYITQRPGGSGAVREVIDLLLLNADLAGEG